MRICHVSAVVIPCWHPVLMSGQAEVGGKSRLTCERARVEEPSSQRTPGFPVRPKVRAHFDAHFQLHRKLSALSSFISRPVHVLLQLSCLICFLNIYHCVLL